jgi:hypothetical protein
MGIWVEKPPTGDTPISLHNTNCTIFFNYKNNVYVGDFISDVNSLMSTILVVLSNKDHRGLMRYNN